MCTVVYTEHTVQYVSSSAPVTLSGGQIEQCLALQAESGCFAAAASATAGSGLAALMSHRKDCPAALTDGITW